MNNPNPAKTPASVLQELCVKRGIIPTYQEVENTPPTFVCQVTCDELVTEGKGRSKKEAKHEAASKMLEMLKTSTTMNLFEEASAADNCVPSPFDGKLTENAVGLLSDLCTEYGLGQPTYDSIREEGPAHAKIFTFQCFVQNFCVEANDRVKKQAKQLAAQAMYTYLKRIIDPRIKDEPADLSFINPSSEPDFRKAVRMFSGCKTNIIQKYHFEGLVHDLHTDNAKYLNAFSNEPEILEEIKNLDLNTPPENPAQYLASLLERANLKYSLIPIESNSPENCIVVLSVDLQPSFNIQECDTTYVTACQKGALKALRFLRLLCFPTTKNPLPSEDNLNFENLIAVKKKPTDQEE